MRHSIACAWLWALASCGCSPAVDARAIAAVRVTKKTEPPQGCRFVGMVDGKDTDRWKPGGLTYDAAVADLRKKTVLGGGNLAVIDSELAPRQDDYPLPSFTVRSRIYACPSSTPPAPSAAPSASAAAPKPLDHDALVPPTRVCEPDCSPGYVCLHATCVSACNPPCGPGERCRADRICYPWPPPAPSSSAPP